MLVLFLHSQILKQQVLEDATKYDLHLILLVCLCVLC